MLQKFNSPLHIWNKVFSVLIWTKKVCNNEWIKSISENKYTIDTAADLVFQSIWSLGLFQRLSSHGVLKSRHEHVSHLCVVVFCLFGWGGGESSDSTLTIYVYGHSLCVMTTVNTLNEGTQYLTLHNQSNSVVVCLISNLSGQTSFAKTTIS